MNKTKNKKTNRHRTNKSREPIIRHHVKRAFHATPKFVHGMVAGAFVGVMIVGVLRTNGIASAASDAASTPDCTANSVIVCGADTVGGLKGKYDDGATYGSGSSEITNTASSIHNIYSWFGISSTDMSTMASYTVTGYVNNSNDVYTGSPNGTHTLVATNAITGGRQDIDGSESTHESVGGTSFWVRPPKVAFEDTNLEAFIVMKNGVFQFAVLYSCANAVKATPVPKPALTCTLFDLTPGTIESNGDQNYSLEAKASAVNGAVISSYDFNFGDNSSKTIDTSSGTSSTTHLYKPGSYTAKVTINGNDSLSTGCSEGITIKKPKTPVPTSTPTPTSTPVPTPIPTTTPTPTPIQTQNVSSLPNTGPGAVIIIAIASVVGGYVFHMGHRHLRNKRRGTHHTTKHHPHRPAHAH